MNKSIEELKSEIDRTDDELLELLGKRFDIASQIMLLKKEAGLPVSDSKREMEIINRLAEKGPKDIDRPYLRHVYKSVFSHAKRKYFNKFYEKIEAKDIFRIINDKPVIIAGPCAIESREQIFSLAETISNMGIKFLRGGAFKPRTSPDSFQGLGLEGLKYMREAADKYNLIVVTEFLESTELEKYYDYVDIVHIGTRNMTSSGFLKSIGRLTAKDQKPVLLKRGFSSTLSEFIEAANYIIKEGNDNVILCLRGIRTFEQIESKLRFTPDLGAILELKEMTDLPIFFDPSHPAGNARYVTALAKAAVQLGARGLMVETHYAPETALSDGPQSIIPDELQRLKNDMEFA